MSADAVAVARRLAEEVLFPAALETDRAEVVPVERLNALADAGFYALAGPPDLCPLVIGSPDAALQVVEVLAGACLTTTFVWMQHHRAVVAANTAGTDFRDRWLTTLCRGETRAGIAFSSLRRPGPPMLRARAVAGGWVFDGTAPWVTGWGRIDIVYVAARDHKGEIVWAFVDAAEGPTLSVQHLDLAAVSASATVTVELAEHFVPDQRVTAIQPFEEWASRDAGELRRNGSLALGVTSRVCSLLGSSGFDAELVRCRASLDGAAAAGMPVARAWASDLAVRAAAALVASIGGRAIVRDHHAQRLAREALFLQVFAQTPAIRAAQSDRWAVPPRS